MKMKTAKTLLIVLLSVLSTGIYGQTADSIIQAGSREHADGLPVSQPASEVVRNSKVITNSQMIGIGYADILDTYLSPEKYDGLELRYVSHTTRDRMGRKWSRMLVHQGRFATVENRSGDGSELSGDYTFDYGFHRNWLLCGGKLHLLAGLSASANIGFLYNTRNENNPAQAHLSLNIAPYGAVSYSFRLWNKPMKIRYEASVPVVGLMFSPNYGQSYYEIFNKGDYDHNVVPTTFVNSPSLRQTLTLDFTLRRTTLRIGYMGDFRQAKVNDLKYHTYSNMLVIGFTRHFQISKIIP